MEQGGSEEILAVVEEDQVDDHEQQVQFLLVTYKR